MQFAKILATAALVLPLACAAQAGPARITVTGQGAVSARPDLATVSLGVTTEGATAAEALGRNSTELVRVLDRLRKAGIAERDLQTSGLSLNPNWTQPQDGSAPRIRGYVASNQLTVRVRALETLGGILDAVVADGANTLNGISFGLADPGPAQDEARRLAVASARAKAQLLTQAAGVGLGPVVEISEGAGYQPPMPMFRAAASAAPVPVAEGEVETTAEVTIVYELKE